MSRWKRTFFCFCKNIVATVLRRSLKTTTANNRRVVCSFQTSLKVKCMFFFTYQFLFTTIIRRWAMSYQLCFLMNKRKKTLNIILNFSFLWNTRKRYCNKYIKFLINFKLSLFINVKKICLKNYCWICFIIRKHYNCYV